LAAGAAFGTLRGGDHRSTKPLGDEQSLSRLGLGHLTFRYKDYRADGLVRRKAMTLATDEFIRRFLLHILPKGFHRIRHYGLFANTGRAANIVRLRELLGSTPPLRQKDASIDKDEPVKTVLRPCPCCGGRMIVIETFERVTLPAVSFFEGFQTPAGLHKTCARSCGRHLKPIT
jgi:hypothetical protein